MCGAAFNPGTDKETKRKEENKEERPKKLNSCISSDITIKKTVN